MYGDTLGIESAPAAPGDMVEEITAYLRLDDDLPTIQKGLSSDAHVNEGIRRYPGLRLLRQDPWETLATFILSSVSNIPRISRTVELIATTLGEPVALDRTYRHTFPGPERLAAVDEAELRRLGCGFRAPYLLRAAQDVASGALRLGQLRGLPYAETLPLLTALHGVGEKVADCVMLFALDRMEAFPVDRWVQRAVAQWYGVRSRRYGDVRDWAWEHFGAHAGYANQYLFWNARQQRRDQAAEGDRSSRSDPEA